MIIIKLVVKDYIIKMMNYHNYLIYKHLNLIKLIIIKYHNNNKIKIIINNKIITNNKIIGNIIILISYKIILISNKIKYQYYN